MQSKPGWLLSVLTLTAHGSSLDIFIFQRNDSKGQSATTVFESQSCGLCHGIPHKVHLQFFPQEAYSIQVLFFLSPSAKPQNYTHMLLGFPHNLKMRSAFDLQNHFPPKELLSLNLPPAKVMSRRRHRPLFFFFLSLCLFLFLTLFVCISLSLSACIGLYSHYLSLYVFLYLSVSLPPSVSLCGSLSMSLPPTHTHTWLH